MRYYDYDDDWPRTMTVAERRQQAREDMAKLGKRKRGTPVIIEGSKIATSFWGKAWCSNLERYSDYASRLPRGRSYVRSGQVVDLQITAGKVVALVSGTEALRDDDRHRARETPAMEGDLPRLRWLDRLGGRAPAGTSRPGRDGPGLPRAGWPVSRAARDQAVVQLPGLGTHVQARGGRAVRRGRPARPAARPAVRVARRRPERVDRGCRAGLDGRLRAGLRQGAAGRRHGGAVRPGNGRRREFRGPLLPPSRNRLVA